MSKRRQRMTPELDAEIQAKAMDCLRENREKTAARRGVSIDEMPPLPIRVDRRRRSKPRSRPAAIGSSMQIERPLSTKPVESSSRINNFMAFEEAFLLIPEEKRQDCVDRLAKWKRRETKITKDITAEFPERIARVYVVIRSASCGDLELAPIGSKSAFNRFIAGRWRTRWTFRNATEAHSRISSLHNKTNKKLANAAKRLTKPLLTE